MGFALLLSTVSRVLAFFLALADWCKLHVLICACVFSYVWCSDKLTGLCMCELFFEYTFIWYRRMLHPHLNIN